MVTAEEELTSSILVLPKTTPLKLQKSTFSCFFFFGGGGQGHSLGVLLYSSGFEVILVHRCLITSAVVLCKTAVQ